METVYCQYANCGKSVGERWPELGEEIYPPLCDDHFEKVGIRIFAQTVKTMTAAAQESALTP